MFTARIRNTLLDSRLDASFYHPAYVQNEQFLRSSGWKLLPLKDAASKMKCGPFGSSLHASSYVGSGIPFVAPVSFSHGFFDESKLEYISPTDHARLASTAFASPALVFARVGDPCCVVVPESVGSFNLHGDVIGVRCKKHHDHHFVFAFLTSQYGRKELERYGAGSTRPRTNTESLAAILILEADEQVQRYIGDKIRQAEAMTAAWRRTRRRIAALLSPFHPDSVPDGRTSRVRSAILTDTLNANPYMARFVRAQEIVDLYSTSTIDELSSSVVDGPFGSNLTVTDYRVSSNAVHPVVRVKNCENGCFNREDLVWIDSAKQSELIRSEVLAGDLLVTKAGRIGSAAVYPEDLPAGNITSHLIRARIKPPLDAYYVAEFLETPVGRAVTLRHSFKSTRPELTKAEIESCPIPLMPEDDMVAVARLARTKNRYAEYSVLMLAAAKLLVEALIEGRCSEADLADAQRALQEGNRDLDRKMLSRLSKGGLDMPSDGRLILNVDGLFGTLDELPGSSGDQVAK